MNQPSNLLHNFQTISSIGTALSKFGVVIGALCVIAYSMRINHFPQDLSVSEGLLFLVTATCFGVIYLLFVASLVGLGISMSPLFQKTLLLLSKYQPDWAKIQLAPFKWSAIVLSVCALFFITVIGRRQPIAYWTLPLLSVFLYFIYSFYHQLGSRLQKISLIKNCVLETSEKINVDKLGDPQKLKTHQSLSILAIFTLPFLVAGIAGELLDCAMEAAHIRITNPVLYIKEPYASLIPKNQQVIDPNTPQGFIRTDSASILFKGFGRSTIIDFPKKNKIEELEIPNEMIIVQKY